MTIQEKWKSLLEEIRTATGDDNNWLNYFSDEIEIGEDVLTNDDINDLGENTIIPNMPFNENNSFATFTLDLGYDDKWKFVNAYENIFEQGVKAHYNVGFSSGNMNPPMFYPQIQMQARSIDGVNHGVYPRTNIYRNGTYAGGGTTSIQATLGLGVFAPNFNGVNYSKRSIKLSIEKLQCPFIIISRSTYADKYGIPDTHLRDLYNNCNSIDEFESYNPQYAEEFKHWCLNYGIDSGEDPTEKEELKKYYIQNQTYKTDSRKSFKEHYENEKNFEFYTSKITKIWGYITESFPYNIVLKCKANVLQAIKRVNNETREIDTISLEQFNNDYSTPQFTYKTLISDGGATFYYGQLRTNIPIFKNKSLSDKFENDEIGEEQALQKGNADIVNPIGEQINNTANNENVYNTSGYEIYTLSYSELKRMFATLHNKTATDWEQVLDGLKFYGSNPIDSVLNLYHLPFNPSLFGSFASQNHATFGAFTLNLDFSINSLINTGKLFSLFNEPITPLFNDFRDYTNIKYTLYLPYFGFVDLRTDEVMERSLSCKCAFDFATHNLKYYIYADGKLINQVETSVGNNVPITVNDNVAKQEQVLQGITQVVGGGLSMGGAVASGVGGGASVISSQIAEGGATTLGAINATGGVIESMGLSASGVLGGASSILQGTKAIYDNAPRQLKGNISNAVAHNDISYPFLIVEVCPSVVPFNEIEMFGKPTNAISTLNNFHGFTIINDIRLHSIANKKHKDMIKMLLSSGVILP